MKFRIYHRAISFLVAVSFLFTGFQNPSYAANQAPSAVTGKSLPSDLQMIKVSDDLAKIEEIYQASGSGVAILIRDAHEIPDAQKNIEALIHYFTSEYGIRLVTLEGAANKLDPQIFKSFPDQTLLKSKLNEYFNRGELAGGTAASIFSDSGVQFEGIEDWNLYEEGIGHYLKAINEEALLTERLKVREDELTKDKKSIYSKELLEVDQAWIDFQTDKTDLITLLHQVSKFQMPDQTDLKLLIEETKRKEDEPSIQIEIRAIAQKIEQFFKTVSVTPAHAGVQRPTLDSRFRGNDIIGGEQVKSDIISFNQKQQQFRLGQVSPQEFGLFLKGLSDRYQLSIDFSHQLSSKTKNQQRIQNIEGSKLFNDLNEYVGSVKAKLIRNEDEKRLNRETDELEVLKRLVSLELTREDWANINKSNNDYRNHVAFYENTEKRDHVLFDNLVKLLNTHEAAIFVAGGFHTQGVTEQLKAKGISYILISPQISTIPEETHYKDHMRGEVSWKNHFKVENGKVNLHQAFVRGVRDDLLNVGADSHARPESGQAQGPASTLKLWRDQIIRDFAVNQKITEANQYTTFIDELTQDDTQKKLLAKLDHFIEGLKNLQTTNQLNEANVLKLLNSKTTPAPPTGVAQIANAELDRTLWSKMGVIAKGSADGPRVTKNELAVEPVSPSRSEVRSLSKDEVLDILHDLNNKATSVSDRIEMLEELSSFARSDFKNLNRWFSEIKAARNSTRFQVATLRKILRSTMIEKELESGPFGMALHKDIPRVSEALKRIQKNKNLEQLTDYIEKLLNARIFNGDVTQFDEDDDLDHFDLSLEAAMKGVQFEADIDVIKFYHQLLLSLKLEMIQEKLKAQNWQASAYDVWSIWRLRALVGRVTDSAISRARIIYDAFGNDKPTLEQVLAIQTAVLEAGQLKARRPWEDINGGQEALDRLKSMAESYARSEVRHADQRGTLQSAPRAEARDVLIRDVNPIVKLSNLPINSVAEIDDIVEPALVNAVKTLFNKNIRTANTSANGHDVRMGHAYIVLDFRLMSEENRTILFDLPNQTFNWPHGAVQVERLNKNMDDRLVKISIPITNETTVNELSHFSNEIANLFKEQEKMSFPIDDLLVTTRSEARSGDGNGFDFVVQAMEGKLGKEILSGQITEKSSDVINQGFGNKKDIEKVLLRLLPTNRVNKISLPESNEDFAAELARKDIDRSVANILKRFNTSNKYTWTLDQAGQLTIQAIRRSEVRASEEALKLIQRWQKKGDDDLFQDFRKELIEITKHAGLDENFRPQFKKAVSSFLSQVRNNSTLQAVEEFQGHLEDNEENFIDLIAVYGKDYFPMFENFFNTLFRRDSRSEVRLDESKFQFKIWDLIEITSVSAGVMGFLKYLLEDEFSTAHAVGSIVMVGIVWFGFKITRNEFDDVVERKIKSWWAQRNINALLNKKIFEKDPRQINEKNWAYIMEAVRLGGGIHWRPITEAFLQGIKNEPTVERVQILDSTHVSPYVEELAYDFLYNDIYRNENLDAEIRNAAKYILIKGENFSLVPYDNRKLGHALSSDELSKVWQRLDFKEYTRSELEHAVSSEVTRLSWPSRGFIHATREEIEQAERDGEITESIRTIFKDLLIFPGHVNSWQSLLNKIQTQTSRSEARLAGQRDEATARRADSRRSEARRSKDQVAQDVKIVIAQELNTVNYLNEALKAPSLKIRITPDMIVEEAELSFLYPRDQELVLHAITRGLSERFRIKFLENEIHLKLKIKDVIDIVYQKVRSRSEARLPQSGGAAGGSPERANQKLNAPAAEARQNGGEADDLPQKDAAIEARVVETIGEPESVKSALEHVVSILNRESFTPNDMDDLSQSVDSLSRVKESLPKRDQSTWKGLHGVISAARILASERKKTPLITSALQSNREGLKTRINQLLGHEDQRNHSVPFEISERLEPKEKRTIPHHDELKRKYTRELSPQLSEGHRKFIAHHLANTHIYPRYKMPSVVDINQLIDKTITDLEWKEDRNHKAWRDEVQNIARSEEIISDQKSAYEFLSPFDVRQLNDLLQRSGRRGEAIWTDRAVDHVNEVLTFYYVRQALGLHSRGRSEIRTTETETKDKELIHGDAIPPVFQQTVDEYNRELQTRSEVRMRQLRSVQEGFLDLKGKTLKANNGIEYEIGVTSGENRVTVSAGNMSWHFEIFESKDKDGKILSQDVKITIQDFEIEKTLGILPQILQYLANTVKLQKPISLTTVVEDPKVLERIYKASGEELESYDAENVKQALFRIEKQEQESESLEQPFLNKMNKALKRKKFITREVIGTFGWNPELDIIKDSNDKVVVAITIRQVSAHVIMHDFVNYFATFAYLTHEIFGKSIQFGPLKEEIDSLLKRLSTMNKKDIYEVRKLLVDSRVVFAEAKVQEFKNGLEDQLQGKADDLQQSILSSMPQSAIRVTEFAAKALGFNTEATNVSIPDFVKGELNAPQYKRVRVISDSDFSAQIVKIELSEILLIIVNNALYAIKDMPDGKVEVVIDDRGESFYIRVINNGPVIPKDVIEIIESDTPITTKGEQGSGVGLHEARRTLRDMGGKMLPIKSEVGSTVFEIVLPKVQSNEDVEFYEESEIEIAEQTTEVIGQKLDSVNGADTEVEITESVAQRSEVRMEPFKTDSGIVVRYGMQTKWVKNFLGPKLQDGKIKRLVVDDKGLLEDDLNTPLFNLREIKLPGDARDASIVLTETGRILITGKPFAYRYMNGREGLLIVSKVKDASHQFGRMLGKSKRRIRISDLNQLPKLLNRWYRAGNHVNELQFTTKTLRHNLGVKRIVELAQQSNWRLFWNRFLIGINHLVTKFFGKRLFETIPDKIALEIQDHLAVGGYKENIRLELTLIQLPFNKFRLLVSVRKPKVRSEVRSQDLNQAVRDLGNMMEENAYTAWEIMGALRSLNGVDPSVSKAYQADVNFVVRDEVVDEVEGVLHDNQIPSDHYDAVMAQFQKLHPIEKLVTKSMPGSEKIAQQIAAFKERWENDFFIKEALILIREESLHQVRDSFLSEVLARSTIIEEDGQDLLQYSLAKDLSATIQTFRNSIQDELNFREQKATKYRSQLDQLEKWVEQYSGEPFDRDNSYLPQVKVVVDGILAFREQYAMYSDKSASSAISHADTDAIRDQLDSILNTLPNGLDSTELIQVISRRIDELIRSEARMSDDEAKQIWDKVYIDVRKYLIEKLKDKTVEALVVDPRKSGQFIVKRAGKDVRMQRLGSGVPPVVDAPVAVPAEFLNDYQRLYLPIIFDRSLGEILVDLNEQDSSFIETIEQNPDEKNLRTMIEHAPGKIRNHFYDLITNKKVMQRVGDGPETTWHVGTLKFRVGKIILELISKDGVLTSAKIRKAEGDEAHSNDVINLFLIDSDEVIDESFSYDTFDNEPELDEVEPVREVIAQILSIKEVPEPSSNRVVKIMDWIGDHYKTIEKIAIYFAGAGTMGFIWILTSYFTSEPEREVALENRPVPTQELTLPKEEVVSTPPAVVETTQPVEPLAATEPVETEKTPERVVVPEDVKPIAPEISEEEKIIQKIDDLKPEDLAPRALFVKGNNSLVPLFNHTLFDPLVERAIGQSVPKSVKINEKIGELGNKVARLPQARTVRQALESRNTQEAKITWSLQILSHFVPKLIEEEKQTGKIDAYALDAFIYQNFDSLPEEDQARMKWLARLMIWPDTEKYLSIDAKFDSYRKRLEKMMAAEEQKANRSEVRIVEDATKADILKKWHDQKPSMHDLVSHHLKPIRGEFISIQGHPMVIYQVLKVINSSKKPLGSEIGFIISQGNVYVITEREDGHDPEVELLKHDNEMERAEREGNVFIYSPDPANYRFAITVYPNQSWRMVNLGSDTNDSVLHIQTFQVLTGVATARSEARYAPNVPDLGPEPIKSARALSKLVVNPSDEPVKKVDVPSQDIPVKDFVEELHTLIDLASSLVDDVANKELPEIYDVLDYIQYLGKSFDRGDLTPHELLHYVLQQKNVLEKVRSDLEDLVAHWNDSEDEIDHRAIDFYNALDRLSSIFRSRSEARIGVKKLTSEEFRVADEFSLRNEAGKLDSNGKKPERTVKVPELESALNRQRTIRESGIDISYSLLLEPKLTPTLSDLNRAMDQLEHTIKNFIFEKQFFEHLLNALNDKSELSKREFHLNSALGISFEVVEKEMIGQTTREYSFKIRNIKNGIEIAEGELQKIRKGKRADKPEELKARKPRDWKKDVRDMINANITRPLQDVSNQGGKDNAAIRDIKDSLPDFKGILRREIPSLKDFQYIERLIDRMMDQFEYGESNEAEFHRFESSLNKILSNGKQMNGANGHAHLNGKNGHVNGTNGHTPVNDVNVKGKLNGETIHLPTLESNGDVRSEVRYLAESPTLLKIPEAPRTFAINTVEGRRFNLENARSTVGYLIIHTPDNFKADALRALQILNGRAGESNIPQSVIDQIDQILISMLKEKGGTVAFALPDNPELWLIDMLIELVSKQGAGRVAIAGRAPTKLTDEFKAKRIPFTTVEPNRSMNESDQGGKVPMGVLVNELDSTLDQSYIPFWFEAGNVSDVRVRDLGIKFQIIAPLVTAQLLMENPNLAKSKVDLKNALLQRFREAGFDSMIEEDPNGGFTISAIAAQAYLEYLADLAIQQAA